MDMDKKAAAAEIKRLRKQAENESIPQEARNEMLDKANEIEYEFYKKEAGMAKGGAVKKGYAKGGAVKKPAAKKEASRQSPVIAVMIGMTDKKKPAAKKTTKMAKGGYANCGASMKPARGK